MGEGLEGCDGGFSGVFSPESVITSLAGFAALDSVDGTWVGGSSSPATRTAHGDTGRLQIRASGLTANSSLLLDPPQRPTPLSKHYDLLLFLFVQDIAHGARA